MMMAAAIETMNSCGGVFLISETAFFATSRGWTFGFSGASALLKTAACTGSGSRISSRGGSSSISEKLRVAAAPGFGPSDIMGSTLIFGASTSGSTMVAEDMFTDDPENDSTEKVSTPL